MVERGEHFGLTLEAGNAFEFTQKFIWQDLDSHFSWKSLFALCLANSCSCQCTRRIVGFGIHAVIVHDEALCRMFKQATRGVTTLPRYLSSDHDPLYRFHQWEANLRILDVTEVKTVPDVPRSHPFIERLIETIRRECLDRLLFWPALDLELKLQSFKDYYNQYRTHSALQGQTPIHNPQSKGAELKNYCWQKHCRGLYQTPIAA